MRSLAKFLMVASFCAVSARAETNPKTARTWKAKCASCHGADGKGQTEQGQKMHIADMTKPDWQKGKTDAQIKDAITNGVKKEGAEMEGYKDKLPPEDIDALVAFVRTLK
jgi:mono/diheme cytochrome c family protein